MNSERCRDEHSCSWQMESTCLPMRGPKSDSTESRWVKMNPIEWIDDLNSKAKASEALKLNGTPSNKFWAVAPQIATSSSLVPANENCTVDNFASRENHAWLHSPVLVPASSLTATPADVDMLVAMVDTKVMPQWWDFRSIQQSTSIDRIRALVLAIEGQPMFTEMKSALEQIRDHFTFSLTHVKGLQASQSEEEFEMLCQDTIHRLQALLMLFVKSHEKEDSARTGPSTPPRASRESIRSSPTTGNKDAFQQHMNNWLRANWINPYPDEAVSHQLAYETGESVNVVNTWLVNARSRRWRPAILRAFELNRPSEFLMEDSINLFEAKPVRPLDDNSYSGSNKRMRLE